MCPPDGHLEVLHLIFALNIIVFIRAKILDNVSAPVLSPERIDYLQRIGVQLQSPVPSSDPKIIKRMRRVIGVGKLSKEHSRFAMRGDNRPATEDVLAGLHALNVPTSFLIRGSATGIQIHIGVWHKDIKIPVNLDKSLNTLNSLVDSLYPAVEFSDSECIEDLLEFPLSGICLGMPSMKSADPYERALPIDRLIRAMAGSDWGCLILSEPLTDIFVRKLRDSLINEMRFVQSSVISGSPKPLADYYMKLLESELIVLSNSQGVGAWRTGVYLLGDENSYHHLASVWKGIFSGDSTIPEPIKIIDCGRCAQQLARGWLLPEDESTKGPGYFRHPFQYQTLLTSSQLAAYVELPNVETAGFTISNVASFDEMPQSPAVGNTMRLGDVIERNRITATHYTVDINSLCRHSFVSGITGSGKTNTILQILEQASLNNIPFLVIEPSKREYRRLMGETDIGKKVQVFTLGNENISPFRLNPFEFVPGIPTVSRRANLGIGGLEPVVNGSFQSRNRQPTDLTKPNCYYLG